VIACRSRYERPLHRLRRAFFSAALEKDNHGVGIAEDPSDLEPGDETGEAENVQKFLDLGHPRIVTSFPRRRKADFIGEHRGKSASDIGSYPHDFTKNPI
jgi:hypothetical protein